MANIFGRRRYTPYGEQAKAEFGEALRDVGYMIAKDLAQAQRSTELSHAGAAWINQKGEFNSYIKENLNRPDLWEGELDKRKEAIFKESMKNINMPTAKQIMSDDLEVDFAQYKQSIRQASEIQTANNRQAAYKIHTELLLKPPAPGEVWTPYIVNTKIGGLWEENEVGFQNKDIDGLETEVQFEAVNKAHAQSILSMYFLNQAELMANPADALKYLENINNEVLTQNYDITFDKDEVDKLKEKYERNQTRLLNANKAVIETERKIVDDIFIKSQDEFLASVSDVLDLINNSTVLPVKDKEEQRKKINDRVNAIREGKIDPVDEFDPQAYKNLSDRIATNPRTVSESVINNAAGKGKNGGITAGENGQQGALIKLKRFLENNEADQRLYSEYTQALSMLKTTRAFNLNKKRNDMLASEAQILLNQWASTENRSPLDYQKFFDGLIDVVGLTNQGLWWSGRAEEQRRASVGMREFAIRMGAELGEEMPTIAKGDTAAWKKLEKGTRYKDSKGNISIK